MADPIRPGTWVEISAVLLPPGARASRLPEDTRRVPLEMRAKGFVVAAAVPGEEAEIETAAGRRLRGILTQANPAYTHGFGPPIPEFAAIGSEVRAALRKRRGLR